jgi:hypothetical protein
MTRLACLLLMVAGMFGLGGCLATPAYSGGENGARILRTWDYEFKQGVEDFDYEMLMLPPSHSTRWNLY